MLVTCSIGCTSNQLLILYMVAINIYNRTRLNRGMGDPLHVVSCYTVSLSPTSEYHSECDRSRTSTPRCCRTRSANTESQRLRPMQPLFRCYTANMLAFKRFPTCSLSNVFTCIVTHLPSNVFVRITIYSLSVFSHTLCTLSG